MYIKVCFYGFRVYVFSKAGIGIILSLKRRALLKQIHKKSVFPLFLEPPFGGKK